MRKFCILLVCAALALVSVMLPAAENTANDWQRGNLIANGDFSKGSLGGLPEGWTVKAPNPALRPQFRLVEGPAGGRLLEAAGNGRKECFGCLIHPVELAGGKTYRFRVRFRFEGFEDVNRHLVHGVFASGFGGFNDGIFTYRKEGERVVGEGRFAGPQKVLRGEVRLYFRYSARGKVCWAGASLQECAPIKPRPVKIAVCQGGGDRKRWEKYLDTAGAKHCDVALLTEFFEDGIQSMHGPSMTFMSQKAKQWKMYVCGTIRLRRGDIVYNSAPLHDRAGKLVGIYDKFMLYDPELDDGTTPGQSVSVFSADFGPLGIMTCYDSWHPEVARLLAYKGAELILFPSAGYYRQLMHARAADNGVVIAASSGSPCGVWDGGGNQADGGSRDDSRCAPTAILAFEKDDSQKMQIVTVDLARKPSPHYWGGPMLSAPGGRRVRATGPTHLEDEIAREAKRWWAEAPAQPAAGGPWEGAIRAFEARDRTSPPPRDAVLFVGSSTICLWKTLVQDFADHKVINRGFGGSQIADCTCYADRIVIPYKPRLIVLRAGGNDIAAGKTPEQVCDDFQAFVEKVRANLPGVPIAYMTINATPARWGNAPREKRANELVKAYISRGKNLDYIDTFDATMDVNGRPREDLFVPDRLHFNAKGYRILTAVVRPHLQ
jgi:predicted amidohydrolase/lysophospholipase L1-like esterase